MNTSLIQKYNVPGPRYTSYPTVPYWNEEEFTKSAWETTAIRAFNESNLTEGISLYIHLPFCESLCTFCGCNKRITKNHGVEDPYIAAVLKEWNMYCDLLGSRPKIKEIHLGGGTPTFFDPDNLRKLILGIFKSADRCKEWEFSFEGHPNNTSYEHLQTLYELGFRRVSFGVQDYDHQIQVAIHRIQPFENVERVHQWAKEIGYTSIGHDLVFGLPKQTRLSIAETIAKTNLLKPDRLAFYSYAHVPWLKGNGQRGFDESDLPKDEDKRALYNLGKLLFEENGYAEIGMDHFALKSDSLYHSAENKLLHRNFMGYTSSKTKLMIGLGVSSISDSWYAFAQNVKSLEEYYALINANELPVFRGHILNLEDLIIRKHILNIMCQLETSWTDESLRFKELDSVIESLHELVEDELILLSDEGLKVTQEGIPFIRNICMAFDLKMIRNKPETRLFSMTI
ncbi:oxygen-independent coproporphyrinogen III oxidase [Solitalea canadensis]|uniref:Coproporphyrinogen-III oxidase n=1 Tax=Solitalea canadensis (strain ATCC 29591 / DSM 3403 / JCM 21819 / LMG 8368 / NBRC 15130 / NCIMB 12057 / USAM 9D) TaxID=929556 RepID=H8KN75_SOLCM|nr:oxygen-independent coproporphyrinogen III oxidase [Solitalea canadensis]AFD09408.1 oxygen-independent coproporphyrinogen III oxidase [Solitalea canadensis DSM 3403]